MPSTPSAERHIETIAALDVAASAALLGLACWLFVGAPVNEHEHALRLRLAHVSVDLSLYFFLLWALVERRWWVGRWLQFVTGAALLPFPPVGTLWGAYILWTLTWRGARGAFGREATSSDRRGPPYWWFAITASLVGILSLGFIAIEGRAAWLDLQVERAANRAAERQDFITHTIRRLRDTRILE